MRLSTSAVWNPLAPRALGWVLALLAITPAYAGVDAWTTTGPRSLWTFIQADARAGGVMFVADFDRWARSANGGVTWDTLPPLPAPAQHRIQAICADPQVPDRFYGALGSGIHRSDDGGVTWAAQPGGIPGGNAQFASTVSALDCESSRLLAAVSGSNAGLYRSDDGASTSFQRVEIPAGPGDVVFARAGERLVVATWRARFAYSSMDRGATWLPNGFVLPDGFAFQSIAWAGGSRYVAVVNSGNVGSLFQYSVWISNDHGVTFVERPSAAFIGGGPRVASDPLQRSRLLISGVLPRVSVDAGETWSVVSGIPAGETARAVTWTAPRMAGGSALFITTPDRGVMLSTDLGMSFIAQNGGLPGAKSTDVDASFYGGERIELMTGAEGLRRRDGTSNRWQRIDNPDCAIVAREVLGLLIGPYGWRSQDAGATWTQQPGVDDGPGCTETTFGRRNDEPATLIAWNRPYASGIPPLAVPSRVWLGLDDGAGWDLLADANDPGAFSSVFGAAVAPSNTQVVYVSSMNPLYVGESFVGQAAYVHRSTDRGVTWTRHRVPGDPFVGQVYVDLLDANRLLLSLSNSNAPLESFDGGTTWNALPAVPSATAVLTITVDEVLTPRRTYAGTDDGVFVRVGNATTWQRVGASQGMRVNKILIDGPPERRTLEIATDSGVFELTLDTAAATLPVYRFYNTQTRTHFYTASEAERQHVLATWPHFIPEGIAFHAVKAERALIGNPVWRFFNTQTGTHFYTAFPSERAYVLATWPQFVEEGVVYRTPPTNESGTVKLFRFFNTETGAHFTTTEDDERDFVNSRLPMFIDEGPTYSVYPAAPPQ